LKAEKSNPIHACVARKDEECNAVKARHAKGVLHHMQCNAYIVLLKQHE
jgi:hypothetical protein